MADRPESITGGCLCGEMRYSISFPPGAEWPPSRNATCQCTRCRKFNGALVPQLLEVPKANIDPSLASQKHYRAYTAAANAKGQRIFCGQCGSSLAYEDYGHPDLIEIHAGSLDEEVLCGRKKETDGTGGQREGGYGWQLCGGSDHMWVENAIPGLTDRMDGEKWMGIRGGELYRRQK